MPTQFRFTFSADCDNVNNTYATVSVKACKYEAALHHARQILKCRGFNPDTVLLDDVQEIPPAETALLRAHSIAHA